MNSTQESTASTDLKARTPSQHDVIKITSLLRGFFFSDRAIFVWPWKVVSVSVCYCFISQWMIRTWTLRFPRKKTLIWERYCSIGQSCCSITQKRSIGKFLESSSGMKFFQPSVRLTNQKPRAFFFVRQTNQVALLFCSRFHFKVIRKSLYLIWLYILTPKL